MILTRHKLIDDRDESVGADTGEDMPPVQIISIATYTRK